MKTLFLFISCLLIGTFAAAQQDTTLIYSNPGYNKDPLRSKWRREVAHKDSLWVVSLYDKKDELKESISYGDEKLSERKGPYAFYEDGKLRETGDFDKGYRYGEWKIFFAGEQLHEKANYAWGTLHGTYRLYWNNGHLRKEGRYSRGKKTGRWRMFHQNGKLALEETYADNGSLAEGTYFDAEGNSVAKTAIVTMPDYKGGISAFNQFFAKEFKLPANLEKDKTPAKLILSFIVTKNGQIEDIVSSENVQPKLKREVLRVLALSLGKWMPGTELGEAVDMEYQLPIAISVQ